MAVAQVEKVEILAHTGIKKEFLTSLQEQGLIQLKETDVDELGLNKRREGEISELEHDLYRLNHAVELLAAWGSKKQKGLKSKPRLEARTRYQALIGDYHTKLDNIEEHESHLNELNSEIKFLEREKNFLQPLMDLDVPLKDLKDTEWTKIGIGILPTPKFEEFKQKSEDSLLGFSIISQDKRQTYIFVICHKSEAETIERWLKELGYNYLYFTEPILDRAQDHHLIKDVMGSLEIEIEDKKEKLVSLKEKGKVLAQYKDELMCVYDVLFNERKKLLSASFLGETDRTFFLEGWIKAADKNKLIKKLAAYDELVEYYFRTPFPDEITPVILENKKLWKPFEIITKLYGLPQRGSIDPTVALAPFFFIFVGLTVSEAGYGMLAGLLCLFFLKIKKPRGGLKLFLNLLVILSAAVVILGTLVGGWFGFPIRSLLLLDPLQDPVSFLILSLALGFIQVWFGTLLKMISEIKQRHYLQAFFVDGGWLLLLPSLVLYGVAKMPAAGILALVGAAGIVFFGAPSRNPLARFFGGLYSLYDISRYLADILSYSRLLALGLATSVIAMVVNTLCQTAVKIPWVGWLFAALIFIGGHMFNLGISFLGGFVHSMRLQFVEFFSKFFTSGGQPFEPFELESKYTEMV